jgi:hypothetical protein
MLNSENAFEKLDNIEIFEIIDYFCENTNSEYLNIYQFFVIGKEDISESYKDFTDFCLFIKIKKNKGYFYFMNEIYSFENKINELNGNFFICSYYILKKKKINSINLIIG